MQFRCIIFIWISVTNAGSVNQIPNIHGVCPLSDDDQGHVGNDIEEQKEDFEQPEERVDDHIEGFPGNGKPFALRAIH